MAFNPFLSMGDPVEPVVAEALNPFMMTSEPEVDFTGDNPFATSNPFADLSSFIPEPVEARPTALSLGTDTASLIQSVTGHMELASTHLLGRLPPTRSPSPISARDLHSACPTPEPELELEPDPPLDLNQNKPARPPPARPPARPPRPPVPPAVPPAPVTVQQDDINLFDAPVPSLVKPTKEAILSLYSAPKLEEKPLDFLSDDLPAAPPPSAEPARDPAALSSPFADVTADELQQYNNDSTRNPFQDLAAPAPKTDVGSQLFQNDEVIDEQTYSSSQPESDNNQSPVIETETNKSDSSPNIFDNTDNGYSTTVEMTPALGSSPTFEMNTNEPNETLDPSTTTLDSTTERLEPSSNTFDTTSNFETTATNVFEDSNINVFATENQNIFQTSTADTFTTSNTNIFETSSSNIFATSESEAFGTSTNVFSSTTSNVYDTFSSNVFSSSAAAETITTEDQWGGAGDGGLFPESQDAFDAFSAKFDATSANHVAPSAWGNDAPEAAADDGFEAEAFDSFLAMKAPPPAPPRIPRVSSGDSPDDNFSLVIRPATTTAAARSPPVPPLAPPPRPAPAPPSPSSDVVVTSVPATLPVTPPATLPVTQDGTDSGPPTPLFDEDQSQPLEHFPRTSYDGPGWEMHLRQPNKKKITGQRFWKKIFVRMTYQGDNPVIQLYNSSSDKEPFQELPLQACYSVSDVAAQQFDQFGKIFTVKLQYIFYKERPGVRPGQVTKAERITNKLSQFAAYAIQGDYQGVKEFGSDLRKLGLPVEHAPQVSQLFKLGSLQYEDVQQLSCCVEEALFRLAAHRDRALTYKMEEIQVTAVDELYVEQDAEGVVLKQVARVRLFFLGFLSGMPDVEMGVNDLRRQGREVVGRHDILPIATEEWIRLEDVEYHACVQRADFEKDQLIRFKPPDACYVELLRFRVRPPRNRELPLQLKATWIVNGNKVELRADVLVPGFASRKLGQIPCEDVSIRFPIPECWIYLFRVEKHFRYGSVKSAHRRTGKIKGIERFLGAVEPLQQSLMEVTSGQAKYEHQHRALVWRMPRLPKEGQGAYTSHNLVCRMALTSYDQVPAELARTATVQFTMPHTTVSHTTVRSVALNPAPDEPPEKYVRYLARHEYLVGIERTSGTQAPVYAQVTRRDTPSPPPAAVTSVTAVVPAPSDSDSDSD